MSAKIPGCKFARYRAKNREKIAAKRREWYAKNREKVLAAAKENAHKKAVEKLWREKNRDAIAARTGAWSAANRQRRCASTAAYRLRHPERVKQLQDRLTESGYYAARDAKRRAAKLRATPAWADAMAIRAVYASCPDGHDEVDHIVPLQGRTVCGLHVEYNLRVIPAAENRAKRNKLLPEVACA